MTFRAAIVGAARRRSGGVGPEAYFALQESLGAIARFKLQETSGITADEDIGNEDGTYEPNDGISWTGGTLGNDGPVEGVTSANFTSTSIINSNFGGGLVGPISIEAWINPDTVGQDDYIVCFHTSSANATRAFFWISGAADGNGTLRFNAAPTISRWSATSTISFGEWAHIVATYDGGISGTGIKIYKNGAEVTYAGDSGAATTTDYYLISIGGRRPSSPRAFDGQMFAPTVYNSVLTSDNILDLYNTMGV